MARSVVEIPVALAGFGTVGAGVMELALSKNPIFESLYNFRLRIVKILVRSPERHMQTIRRDPLLSSACGSSEGELKALFCTSPAELLQSGAKLIVELIGGCTDAKEIVYHSLQNAIPVVTANKALIFQYLDELANMAGKTFFGFEAAVCGGIPIIRSLSNDFVADEVQGVAGIMNGTTNFMLSKMETEGADYMQVLKEAQSLGFAEADPTADVGGFDARDKLGILAKLAFGVTLKDIPCEGITQVSKIDFEYAKMLGCTVKLLGCVKKDAKSNRVSCFVSPHLVPADHAIAACRGPTNLCAVTSKNMGLTVYQGPGAGRYPTANSVMNDIVRACQEIVAPKPQGSENLLLSASAAASITGKNCVFDTDYTCDSFYVRIRLRDGLGIVKELGEAAEAAGVSIAQMLQNLITDKNDVYTVVTTDSCSFSQVCGFVDRVSLCSWCKEKPVVFPMM
ncbi:unnamed protein product [Amoebophrya sp. A25]|nr:unnamed protein product [Amoebophrya sp. A25]|eukprot:GSA25T00004700001.1